MIAALLLLLGSSLLHGQAAREFKPTAELGKPVLIGYETFIIGSKEKIETATLRELTLTGAELALSFPNRHEIVAAGKEEKLLILRGSIRNPEKTTNCVLGSSNAVAFALWQRYRIPGKFKHVAHFDPETLQPLSANLKPGESAKFAGVWRVPADLNDFRVGLLAMRSVKVAWYDLSAVIQPIRSVFASGDGRAVTETALVAAGQTFDLDGLDLQVVRSGYDAARGGLVVFIKVTNRVHLVPARWGWQYLTAELIPLSGPPPHFYPDIIDDATGQSWAGDIPPGATMTGRLLFTSPTPVAARALRLVFNATGHAVEVSLGR